MAPPARSAITTASSSPAPAAFPAAVAPEPSADRTAAAEPGRRPSSNSAPVFRALHAHRWGRRAPIKPYPLRNCGPLRPKSLTRTCGVKRCVSSPGMHMSNHSAKFASAIFATILAGTNFAAVPESGAKTADNCLSGPKGTIPAGHHWYYRIDRATKRQCWYSREERDRTARATPQDRFLPPSKAAPPSAAASNPVPPPQSPTVSKSVADARAELSRRNCASSRTSTPNRRPAAPRLR